MPGTFIDFLFEPPWIYILMLGGGLFGVWWLLRKYNIIGGPKPQFKGETLENIIQNKNLTRIVKTYGHKVKNAKLILNMKNIKIGRVISFPAKVMVRETTEGSKGKIRAKFVSKDRYFLVFKAGGGIFESIPLVKYMHRTPEYFLIRDDKQFITKDPDANLWTINRHVFPHTFGGVWVFSTDGVNFLTEFAYKRMQENDKEESVNALKRFIFYNDQFTGRIVGMERKQELKDESWEKAKVNVD